MEIEKDQKIHLFSYKYRAESNFIILDGEMNKKKIKENKYYFFKIKNK